jgi:hypothetical protein
MTNRPLEDQISLLAKLHLDGSQARFSRPWGSVDPLVAPLATAFGWLANSGSLLNSICLPPLYIGLPYLVGLFVSVTHDGIFYVLFLCLLRVFLLILDLHPEIAKYTNTSVELG